MYVEIYGVKRDPDSVTDLIEHLCKVFSQDTGLTSYHETAEFNAEATTRAKGTT
jgi:hypothetical protein